MRAKLVGLAMSLVLFGTAGFVVGASTAANATSFFDTDFLATNVTSTYVVGTTSDVTVVIPCSSCGVGGTAGFQFTALTGNNAGVFIGETNWVYNPAILGPIASISGSIDRALSAPGNLLNNAQFRLAVEQGGNIYFTSIPNGTVLADGTNHNLSGSGLTASSFGLFTAGGFSTPGSQHPDFTQTFEFGYLTLSNVIGAVSSFDNLSITVDSTPLPAALPLFATGLGALGLLARRRKRKLAA
jgi:hypothetical protein